MAHLYIYIYIKIVICNGNFFHEAVFFASICWFWINILHQISLPESLFSHLSSNFATWQTHMVTHPQSIILFSAANHLTKAILRYSVLYHPFGKTDTLRSSNIISGSAYGVMSNFRVLMQLNLYLILLEPKVCI